MEKDTEVRLIFRFKFQANLHQMIEFEEWIEANTHKPLGCLCLFVGALLASGATGGVIYGLVQVGTIIHDDKALVNKIEDLNDLPTTVCRLTDPFTHRTEGGKVYVSVEYSDVSKNFVPSTLIYPIIGTKDKGEINRWLIELKPAFECRIYSDKYTINYIPDKDPYEMEANGWIVGIVFFSIFTCGLVSFTCTLWASCIESMDKCIGAGNYRIPSCVDCGCCCGSDEVVIVTMDGPSIEMPPFTKPTEFVN